MLTTLACVLLAVTALSGCRGRVAMQIKPFALRNQTIAGHTDAKEERGALHPAVIHAIMRLPQLPFAYGGHLGPLDDHSVLDTRPLVPKLNNLFAEHGSAVVVGSGSIIVMTLSRRAKGVLVGWAAGAQRGKQASMWIDLSKVPGAFSDGASLTMAEARRHIVVVGEAQ